MSVSPTVAPTPSAMEPGAPMSPLSGDDLWRRGTELIQMNDPLRWTRATVRAILNGGPEAVRVLLGDDEDTTSYLPVANLMLSGLERQSQRIGILPAVRVEPPWKRRENDADRRSAEKRERIIETYDRWSNLSLQQPQAARWLLGYGFVPYVISDSIDSKSGQPFPNVEIRDPFNVSPAPWSMGQQPEDMVIQHIIPERRLKEMYPGRSFRNRRAAVGGAVLLDNTHASGNAFSGSNWSNPQNDGIEVWEYFSVAGRTMFVPETREVLTHVATPDGVPRPFHVAKRFAFDRLVGQFDHMIGLMGMMARLNVLAFISVLDDTFAEALALDTPIPTPTGWTTMGALQAGDLILGDDGLPVEVLEAKEIQYGRRTFDLTFEDGSVITASDGHLWQSKDQNHGTVKVRTTLEMFDAPVSSKFRVPAPQPWKLPEADLPIDPYVLGLWLGDGTTNNAIVTAHEEDMPHVIEQVEAVGYATKMVAVSGDRAPQVYISTPDSEKGRNGSGLHGQLRMLGVLGDKHIPHDYMRSSVDQRLELLRGLMDADGCASKAGHCSFSNANESLIEQVRELLSSLGEIVSRPVIQHSELGTWFRITWTARQFNPFRLPRKADRVTFHSKGSEWVTIKTIEEVESVPVRCIAVANQSRLFLAGPTGTVTHNTNIIGDMLSPEYQRGRFANNVFTQGTRIEKGTGTSSFEAFQQIDRIERQARLVGAYPVTDDAQSPNSFVTGQGLRELTSSSESHDREYWGVIEYTLQEIDEIRFRWAESRWPSLEIENIYSEKFTPKTHIKGRYSTTRKVGLMAGLDSNAKTIGLTNLGAAGYLDRLTVMENLDGVDDPQKVMDRLRQQEAEQALRQAMMALMQGQPPNPQVLQALIADLPSGETKERYANIFFPETAPDDLSQAPAEGPPQPEPMAQPGDTTTTMLARLTGAGTGGSGIQTVSTVGG